MKKKRVLATPGFLEGVFTRQERLALGFIVGAAFGGMALLCLWRGRIPWMSPAQGASVRLAVRVNAAPASEIAGLPGIGPTVAQRIVEDRRRHGHFLTLADLKRVKGVSRKALGQIQSSVRFD